MTNRGREERRHRRNLAKALAKTHSDIPTAQANSQTQPTPTQPAPQTRSLGWRLGSLAHQNGKLAWRAFVVFAVVLGAVAGCYSLRPQISVTAAQSMNKGWPYEPIFTVTDVGYAEIYEVTFECASLHSLRTDGAMNGVRSTIKNHQNAEPGNNISPEPVLRPQTPVTKTCATSSEIPGTHIEWIAVTLVIKFRPSFWHWRMTKFARFRSRADPNGQIQWISDPTDDPFEHR
jgi:hypothetical protein